MLTILKDLAEKSRWKTECFDGLLHLSGRVLSPIEAQAAGIASKTLMMKMMQVLNKDETTEQDQILQKIDALTPEDLLSFGAMQDRIICQVVDKASQDGESWEKLIICQHETQQNPLRNVLWVGVLSQDDKNIIFENAMVSVKEAATQAENF
tara:strand:- start:1042 stop:1497 length:456 start_codon:yes stop_codon:yes gene_type:complete